jgi:hypothetical protein
MWILPSLPACRRNDLCLRADTRKNEIGDCLKKVKKLVDTDPSLDKALEDIREPRSGGQLRGNCTREGCEGASSWNSTLRAIEQLEQSDKEELEDKGSNKGNGKDDVTPPPVVAFP